MGFAAPCGGRLRGPARLGRGAAPTHRRLEARLLQRRLWVVAIVCVQKRVGIVPAVVHVEPQGVDAVAHKDGVHRRHVPWVEMDAMVVRRRHATANLNVEPRKACRHLPADPLAAAEGRGAVGESVLPLGRLGAHGGGPEQIRISADCGRRMSVAVGSDDGGGCPRTVGQHRVIGGVPCAWGWPSRLGEVGREDADSFGKFLEGEEILPVACLIVHLHGPDWAAIFEEEPLHRRAELRVVRPDAGQILWVGGP